jgi:hypothetical protein
VREAAWAYCGFGWVAGIGDVVNVHDSASADDIRREVSLYDEVLVSISSPAHLSLTHMALGDDIRVLCGGPMAGGWRGANAPYMRSLESLPRLASLGLDYRSAHYSIDWLNALPGKLRYSIPLSAGTGCVWSRCLFCGDAHKGKIVARKHHKEALVSAAKTDRVNLIDTCIAGPSPRLVSSILDTLPTMRAHDVVLSSFVRANDAIEGAASHNSLEGFLARIGREALSDFPLTVMNKGETVADILQATESLLMRGANVCLTLMRDSPMEHPADAAATVARLEDMYMAYDGLLSVSVGSPTAWPSRELARMAGGQPVRTADGWWMSVADLDDRMSSLFARCEDLL